MKQSKFIQFKLFPYPKAQIHIVSKLNKKIMLQFKINYLQLLENVERIF